MHGRRSSLCWRSTWGREYDPADGELGLAHSEFKIVEMGERVAKWVLWIRYWKSFCGFICNHHTDTPKTSYTLIRKALPWFFLCILSSLACLEKPVFSKRDLLRWKVPAMLYLGSSDRREGTSQPVTISKKWKNPSFTFRRKRTWVHALPWVSTGSLGLPASGTDLKSLKGLYSGPSPLQTTAVNACPLRYPAPHTTTKEVYRCPS
jgi:hypothetical protein